MRSIVKFIGKPGTHLLDVETPVGEGLLIRTLEVAIDGTDEEIVADQYGEPPRGQDHLILGHEALGLVASEPEEGQLFEGALVVPTVRRGCGICTPCRGGQSDFCRTGLYLERGIKGAHGFMVEEFRESEANLVKIPPSLKSVAVITEPISIAYKAIEQAIWMMNRLPDQRLTDPLRSRRVLVCGTGPLGIMISLLAVDAGAHVFAADRHRSDSHRAQLLSRWGVGHLNAADGEVEEKAHDLDGFEVIVEATGSSEAPFDFAGTLSPNGVMVLLGVPPPTGRAEIEAARLLRDLVLKNQVVVGSVNSNISHFRKTVEIMSHLEQDRPGALGSIISHRFPSSRYKEAFGMASDRSAIKRVLAWN